jgi:ABC-2 type transport system ATP-binding protein
MTKPLVFEGVSKRFGKRTALRELSLGVRKGQVLGVLGRNGAGKSTLLGLAAGFCRPSSGRVSVLGASAGAPALRGRVGVVPQAALLPPHETARNFLRYLAELEGVRRAAAAVERALDAVRARDWADTRCDKLSQGMAQRVSLAQALIVERELLLLDEPGAGFDVATERLLVELIRNKPSNCTVVLASHDFGMVEALCDAALVLDQGELMLFGNMDELCGGSRELSIEVDAGEPVEAVAEVLRGLGEVRVNGDRHVRLLLESAGGAKPSVHLVFDALSRCDTRIRGVRKGDGLAHRFAEVRKNRGALSRPAKGSEGSP